MSCDFFTSTKNSRLLYLCFLEYAGCQAQRPRDESEEEKMNSVTSNIVLVLRYILAQGLDVVFF